MVWVECLGFFHSWVLSIYFLSQVMLFMCGARIGFYRGDVKLLIEDIQALKPTIFISVPRLLNRVYDKVSWPRSQNQLVMKTHYKLTTSLLHIYTPLNSSKYPRPQAPPLKKN